MNTPVEPPRIILHEQPACTVLLQQSQCPACGDYANAIEWKATARLEINHAEPQFPSFHHRDPIERARRDVLGGEAASRYSVTALCEEGHSWPTTVRANFTPALKEATP